MNGKVKPIRLFWLLAMFTSVMAGCGKGDAPIENDPSTVQIRQVDHIDEPEQFQNRKRYVNEGADQDRKFNFEAEPGESVAISNPSADAISAEDIAAGITVKNGYLDAEGENDPAVKNKSYLQAPRKGVKSFRLYDPKTKRQISRLEPNARALLKLDEPTEPGDLTIYQKEEGLPINFEGKSSGISEYIVATKRPDVNEYEDNGKDIPGLLVSSVLDEGDLGLSAEGSFVYAKATGFREGDQFWIGDHETFDASSTFYTFFSEMPEPGGGYRVKYTAPDYSICYKKVNLHAQSHPLDFDDPSTTFTLPDKESLLRELNAEGGLVESFKTEIVPNMILNSPNVPAKIKRAWTPSLNTTVNFGRATVQVNLGFSTEASAFICSGTITISVMVKAGEGGSLLVRGGASLYMKKTFDTYADYSVQFFPYPKLKYVFAMKTTTEWCWDFSLGVAYAMKPEKEYDIKKETSQTKDIVNNALADAGATSSIVAPDPSGDNPGSPVVDAAAPNSALPSELNGVPAVPKLVKIETGKAEGEDDYTYNWPPATSTPKYVGDGIVMALGGFHFVWSAITLELGLSFYFTPTIQGRFFCSYSSVSTSVVCKVSSGFSVPKTYSDDVEESRGYMTVGLYAQVGVEVGFIFEMMVYITGTKSIVYVSASVSVGLYILLEGVLMLTWGDDISTTFMGYLSFELGLAVKIGLTVNGLKGKIVVNAGSLAKKFPLAAFGTNLHFLDFADKRKEFEWVGNHNLRIDDMGILDMVYFSTSSFTVEQAPFKWNDRSFFASFFKKWNLRIFDKMEILEGKEYVSFVDDKGIFVLSPNAPSHFDFKFRISTNGWLGVTCGSKTMTVHYFSSALRFISFEGGPEPSVIDGNVHLAGGVLNAGDIYEAPALPAKDGKEFVGWIGNNGLFLEPGERMEVGGLSIAFTPIWNETTHYLVNFYKGSSALVSSQKIVAGGTAEAPVLSEEGKTFLGFDHDVDEVYGNINAYAIFVEGDVGEIPDFTKEGTNIKAITFGNAPEEPIAKEALADAGISLRVEYSDRSISTFKVDSSWFADLDAGEHVISFSFRGRLSRLRVQIA